MEETQGDIKKSSMRFRGHCEKLANFVVGVCKFGKSSVDLTASCWCELLRSQSVMQVLKVKGFQGPKVVKLSEILSNVSNCPHLRFQTPYLFETVVASGISPAFNPVYISCQLS